MIVYGSKLSQPTRMVLWTCSLLKIPHEFKAVAAMQGEHTTEEFLRLNPNANFPVLKEKDSGFVLYESNAIARYLCDVSKDSQGLVPKDVKAQALMNQWLDWKHGSLRQGLAGTVRRRVMAKMTKDISKHSMSKVIVEVKEERELRQYVEALTVLENQLSKTKMFIVDGTKSVTLADLAIFEEVEQVRLLPADEEPPTGSNLRNKFPHIVQWQDRMRQLPFYDVVHKYVG